MNQVFSNHGAGAEDRTPDLLITSECTIPESAVSRREHESGGGSTVQPNAQQCGDSGSDVGSGGEASVYNYHDAVGQFLFQVIRDEWRRPGKPVIRRFRQRCKGPDGWAWSVDGTEPVLYRLPKVLSADRVWLVEGEKDVHTLEALGLVATTIPGGPRAGWAPGFTAALAGRQVVLCGDGDKPGQEHMARCAVELRDAAAALFKCALPEWAKDVTEYMDGHTLADLEELVRPVPRPAPAVEKLCPCGEPSEGWPGDNDAELCQGCWEAYCSKTWWAAVDTRGLVEPLEPASRWRGVVLTGGVVAGDYGTQTQTPHEQASFADVVKADAWLQGRVNATGCTGVLLMERVEAMRVYKPKPKPDPAPANS